MIKIPTLRVENGAFEAFLFLFLAAEPFGILIATQWSISIRNIHVIVTKRENQIVPTILIPNFKKIFHHSDCKRGHFNKVFLFFLAAITTCFDILNHFDTGLDLTTAEGVFFPAYNPHGCMADMLITTYLSLCDMHKKEICFMGPTKKPLMLCVEKMEVSKLCP